MADATKIYGGPINYLGIAAADTADGGSFTDLGYIGAEGAAMIEWAPQPANLSDGNVVQHGGKGTFEIELLQTDPAGILTTLETYETAKAKLKIGTRDSTNGYYFIDDVFVSARVVRDFKPGGVHKVIITGGLITDNADDFCNGPKAAS